MSRSPLFAIRCWLCLFVAGLVMSGLTAIPLIPEVSVLYRGLHYFDIRDGAFHDWIQQIYASLLDVRARSPFLFYGSDWLAFGHFVIALAFVGPISDPKRNVWVIQFGLLACLLLIPWAFIFGAVRGIPWWWRLFDCSFGIFGMVPLMFAYRLTLRLP